MTPQDEKDRAKDEKHFADLASEFDVLAQQFGLPEAESSAQQQPMFSKTEEGPKVEPQPTAPQTNVNDMADLTDSETLKLILNELQVVTEMLRQMVEG